MIISTHSVCKFQWMVLQCQTLSTAVHVIVLVCWLVYHCLVTLMLAMRLPMQSSLMNFWRSFTGLVQLIFSFPSWFHTIWFYCSHTFHSFLSQITLCFSFGSKDMITTFTCLPSYRHSSFTLRAYICWRHTYCQWPIIALAKNIPPKNKRPYGMPFVTKLEVAYGHHVSELRREKKKSEKKRKEELHSLTLALTLPYPRYNPNPIPIVH